MVRHFIIPYGRKLWHHESLAKLMTDQKFTKFSPSKFFYASIVKTHMSVVMSILQYFKCVPVKLESATDEWDEQLPEPNSSLNKSVATDAIELANAEISKIYDIFLGTCQTTQGIIDHLDSHGRRLCEFPISHS